MAKSDRTINAAPPIRQTCALHRRKPAETLFIQDRITFSRSFRNDAQATNTPVNMTAAIHPRANVNPKMRPSETCCQIREIVDAMNDSGLVEGENGFQHFSLRRKPEAVCQRSRWSWRIFNCDRTIKLIFFDM
jgi:hypothetical protein